MDVHGNRGNPDEASPMDNPRRPPPAEHAVIDLTGGTTSTSTYTNNSTTNSNSTRTSNSSSNSSAASEGEEAQAQVKVASTSSSTVSKEGKMMDQTDRTTMSSADSTRTDDDDDDSDGSLKKKKKNNALESEWARRDAAQDYQVVLELQKAVADAGTWAYGIIAVEVWALRDTELYAPEGGRWMDPLAHRGQCQSSTGCNACRLTDAALPSYIAPDPVAVGEGLPGILWEESGSTNSSSKLHWRHLPELIDDPHRQWNRRMQWWVECGITWAAGVPFSGHNNHKGIIIYLARSGIALPLLQSLENEDYLRAVSLQIGSLYAISSSRKMMIAKRRKERDAVLHRIKIKLLAVVRFGGSIKTLTENEVEKKRRASSVLFGAGSELFDGFGGSDCNSQESFDAWRSFKGKWGNSLNPQHAIVSFQSPLVSLRGWFQWLVAKLTTTARKTKGKGIAPPPLPAWEVAGLAGVGSFMTILILARLNVLVASTLGGDYTIVIGPMGAFVTLLYGLTAAPAAQPLNAMCGQAIAMTLSILISSTNLDLYLKQSLATGLAVFVMVKLGLTHPPAGASALVYSSGNFGFGNMALSMLAVFIAILTAALMNNLHSKRQYPTFWGIGYVADVFGISEWTIKI